MGFAILPRLGSFAAVIAWAEFAQETCAYGYRHTWHGHRTKLEYIHRYFIKAVTMREIWDICPQQGIKEWDVAASDMLNSKFMAVGAKTQVKKCYRSTKSCCITIINVAIQLKYSSKICNRFSRNCAQYKNLVVMVEILMLMLYITSYQENLSRSLVRYITSY